MARREEELERVPLRDVEHAGGQRDSIEPTSTRIDAALDLADQPADHRPLEQLGRPTTASTISGIAAMPLMTCVGPGDPVQPDRAVGREDPAAGAG